MDKWMPDTDEVRNCYGAGVNDGLDYAPHEYRMPPGKKYGDPGYVTNADAEFDRWLNAERARIWLEGWDANDAGGQMRNPYEAQ